MTGQQVNCAPVWSGPLRLAHWLIAAATLALLGSGWLMGIEAPIRAAAKDYHYLAGYVLTLALALRLYLLLFGQAAAHWRDLSPKTGQGAAIIGTLKFYLSLGRTPLPRWFAHNPLWGPIYLALFVVLVALAGSGFLLDTPLAASGAGARELHLACARITAWFCLFHVAAVFAHDLKGGGADVSAMINGRRIFPSVEPPPFSARGSDRDGQTP